MCTNSRCSDAISVRVALLRGDGLSSACSFFSYTGVVASSTVGVRRGIVSCAKQQTARSTDRGLHLSMVLDKLCGRSHIPNKAQGLSQKIRNAAPTGIGCAEKENGVVSPLRGVGDAAALTAEDYQSKIRCDRCQKAFDKRVLDKSSATK